MSIVFGYEDYRKLVLDFASKTPQLLSECSTTSDLAREIDGMNIHQILDHKFTVAIIGQMRSGKSTLLNALIQQELSPTGVNETTATINWFRYSKEEFLKIFRVHWSDGTTQDIATSEIQKWIGNSEHAKKTKAIDLFSASPFLTSVNLVDTPGTRSVLTSHESVTQSFLYDAERLEKDTLVEGGRADAVIYVLNPVAKDNDTELLELFGDKTRLPGSSPYNSIAVIQKWELNGLNGDDIHSINPIEWVEKKCKRIEAQLEGKVAQVIYASGWLANIAIHYPVKMFTDLIQIYKNLDLDMLFLNDEFFQEEFLNPNVPLMKQREYLYKTLGFERLKMLIWIIHHYQFQDGDALRKKVFDISQIRHLKNILQKRFLTNSALIKTNTILRKAWEPCTVGIFRLQNLEEQKSRTYQRGLLCLQDLKKESNNQSQNIMLYVNESLDSIREDLLGIKKIRSALEVMKEQVFANFSILEEDISSIDELDQTVGNSLTEEEKQQLRILFGTQGTDIWKRLGFPSPDVEISKQEDKAFELLDYWEPKIKRGTSYKNVAQHASHLLNKILNYLETTAQ